MASPSSKQLTPPVLHSMPAPHVPPHKPPEVPSTTTAGVSSSQAPAQLALLLSNALADVDALRRALSDEKRRASRAERLLATFHPNTSTENGISEEHKSEQLSEGALKAVLDAESRAERAERSRDDALHALHSLSTQFIDVERYESTLSLRAADARGAFSRLLTSITGSLPPPSSSSSPTSSGATGSSRSPTQLILPGLPPPLPAPSVNSIQHLSGPGAPPISSSSTTIHYTRPPPAHSLGYPAPAYSQSGGHSRSSSHNAPPPFSSLPLPPPPSASGLAGDQPSSPQAKRVHRSRSTREVEDDREEPKRRRVGAWEMVIDDQHSAHHADQPLPYPQHQSPLSVQPTQRVAAYERGSNGAQSVNSHAYPLGRVDARELVRDAKERERRGRSMNSRAAKEGERRRRQTVSRSSAASSQSIDEMLLETATDGDRVRRENGHNEQSACLPPVTGPPPTPSHADHPRRNVDSHSSQASTGSVGGERERHGKVPATQLMTLGPDGVVVSGGGSATSLPGGGFPAYNADGQRLCRQCGVAGRYKEGKCVEKWGPGPEGPGTVCDRCRKKMKRVERRGTLDSAAASAQQQAFLTHRQNHSQLQSYPSVIDTTSHSPRSHATVERADTLLLHPHSRTQLNPSPRSVHSHERDGSSRSGSPTPLPDHAPRTADDVHHGVLALQSQDQNQGRRRAPTPPYIDSIRDEEDDDGVEEHEGDFDVDAEIARAAASPKVSKNGARNGRLQAFLNNVSPYPPSPKSRASSTSTTAASEKRRNTRAPAKESAVSRPSRRRDALDELDEDDADGDVDADTDVDGLVDADADAEIRDAVDAAMKVEE